MFLLFIAILKFCTTQKLFSFPQYCFEPIPAITIKEVADSLITSYRGTTAILGYTKPNEAQPIIGFSIRVRNESGYAVKGYEIGLQKFDEFTPGQRITITDVL